MLNSLSHVKPYQAVPKAFIVLLVFAIILQISWHKYSVTTQAQREFLSSAPNIKQIQVMALREPEIAAKLLMLWIQSLDNQPGISLSLNELNYNHLIDWLHLISQLDARSEYPLFSATHFYAGIKNQEKQRSILGFIEQRFNQYPERYWRWLAHASIIARHRLHDNDLALHYAKLLRLQATNAHIPSWAKQLEIGILEEQGEYESVKLLIGGLLMEGKITDSHELLFLNERLKQMENR